MTASKLSPGREKLLRKLQGASDGIPLTLLNGPEKTMLPFFLYQSKPLVTQEKVEDKSYVKITEAGCVTLFQNNAVKKP